MNVFKNTLRDVSRKMFALTINAEKDLIAFSGKELTDEQRTTILRDMCILATQNNSHTNSYLVKMAETFNIDAIEKSDDGSIIIKREALLEQYREQYGDTEGMFTLQYFEKEAQQEAKGLDSEASNLPLNYDQMKRTIESRAKKLLLARAVLSGSDKDFEGQIDYLFEGDNQFAQDFLKEFLGDEFSRDPQFMNKIMVINNKMREHNVSQNQLITDDNVNPKSQMIILTAGIKDLSLYSDGKLSEAERYAVLTDMCHLATHDTKITNKILLQMAEKFNIDITSKDEDGNEVIDRKKLMEHYNKTVEDTFNMKVEEEDRVSIDYFRTEVESLTKSKVINVQIPKRPEDILKMAEEQAKSEMFAQVFLGEVDDFEGKLTELVEHDVEYSKEYIKNLLQSFDNMDPKYQDRVMRMSSIINSASNHILSTSDKEQDSSGHVLSANEEALNNLKKSTNMFRQSSDDGKSTDDDAR